MNKVAIDLGKNTFGKVKEIIEQEYTKITIRSSGRVHVTKIGKAESPKIVIKKNK